MRRNYVFQMLLVIGILLSCTPNENLIEDDLNLKVEDIANLTGKSSKSIELKAVLGQPLFLNPPDGNYGGGFSGPLIVENNENLQGYFSTNLLPGFSLNIFQVLGALFQENQVQTDMVSGVFSIPNGEIYDNHVATLQIMGPASTAGYELLVLATANGTIVGGTGKYSNVTGTSSLSLEIEIDIDNQLPFIARESKFEFEIE